jgi:molybdopterin-guanine dinucleotide biosynthesis protein A
VTIRLDARTLARLLEGPAFAAVVLAGGPGTRMGNPAKATLPVGGVALLSRVLAAVAGASPRIVVGPPAGVDLPADVITTVEEPAGGGPVAATAAGLDLLGHLDDDARVAVLAADLPFLGPEDVTLLRGLHRMDGAILVDDDAHPQWLCGVWRLGALRSRLAAVGDPSGVAMRQLVKGLKIARMVPQSLARPPWFDCDTPDDLRRAEEWAHVDPG